MSLRAQLLRSMTPPRLTRFAALVDAAIAFNRRTGEIDLGAAIKTIERHADPDDRRGFDAPTARRLARAALAEGGWRERTPGVWVRSA